MSNGVEDDNLDWKAIFALLRDGKVAQIPCETERDCTRRENQIAKRSEKKGISVEVHRGEGVLRIEPVAGAVGNRDVQPTGPTFLGD